MGIEAEQTYAINQAVRLLGVTYRILWWNIQTRNLQATKFGSVWAIHGSDLLNFLASHKRKAI